MTTAVATAEKPAKPIDVVRYQLGQMEGQFKAALPAHIPVERFARVVMTAIQNNSKLLECDRASLFNACMRAAQDGLLPDGRDGAIVPYGEDEEGRAKSKIAQWMPMIGGIRKKARNSGEIATWEAHVVCQNDKFEYELGDESFIRHRPALDDRGPVIAAYSIARLKDGSVSREIMGIKEIEGIQSKSKAKKGPWKDPIFFPEMCRKVVARRHAKVLPMSSDLDDLIRRDDELYDLEGAKDEAQAHNGGRPQSLHSALDNLAAMPSPQTAPTMEHQPHQDVGADTAEQGNAGQGQLATQQKSAKGKADAKSDEPPVAGPDNPEGFRNRMKWIFSAAKDKDALANAWEQHVEAVKDKIFPPDWTELQKLYDARIAELAA